MQVIDKFELTADDIDRIVGMAWEDRTPFEAITSQFGLSEAEVIKLMKDQMTLSNWKKWRARVQGRKTKHLKLASEDMDRFKSAAQKSITKNRISRKRY